MNFELKKDLKGYLNKVVDSLKNCSPKELLSYAIFNEKAEVEYYNKLAENAKRESIKTLFIQMSDESREHYEKLYKLFKKLYPNEEPLEIEVPPVEVLPFYPQFESLEEYLEALRYCMESELFAKRTYEMLAQTTKDEESQNLAIQLAFIEEDHYQRIKKAYELTIKIKEARKKEGEDLKPGGYLFDETIKARYLFLDLPGGYEKVVFSRTPPGEIKQWMKKDITSFWITPKVCSGCISPRKLLESLPELSKENFPYNLN